MCVIDSMTISLIPLEDQIIQINVSIHYANTTGFIVIVQKKHANTLFSQEMDNQKGFLLW